jgi:hypothetical protein
MKNVAVIIISFTISEGAEAFRDFATKHNVLAYTTCFPVY